MLHQAIQRISLQSQPFLAIVLSMIAGFHVAGCDSETPVDSESPATYTSNYEVLDSLDTRKDLSETQRTRVRRYVTISEDFAEKLYGGRDLQERRYMIRTSVARDYGERGDGPSELVDAILTSYEQAAKDFEKDSREQGLERLRELREKHRAKQ